ncbi:ABC transporter ATP-binding protein [Candidatus Woesearchaeota archaeon]|nr:ABC transporter ATP-binding protein [Candidatus Woesearchaeota archaeon]
MQEPVFKVRGVSKAFNEHVVLDNIDLDIYSGEIIGIIGASGAGKTTFLNTLIGFLRPDKGDIQFRLNHLLAYKNSYIYRSVFKKQSLVKQVYGFASQVPSFYDDLTTKENLEYFGLLYNLSRDAIKSNAETLLNLMDLKDASNTLAKNLSGGMERRLDIACALMHDPDVLILDEPTADLDPMLRNHIWQLVRKINQKGTTIILSSHHLSELEALCNRVAIIKDSKILAVGKPEEIKKQFMVEKEIILQTNPGDYKKIVKELSKKDISRIRISNHTLHIHSSKPEHVMLDVMTTLKKSKEDLTFINVTSASLDDVFISIWEDKEE